MLLCKCYCVIYGCKNVNYPIGEMHCPIVTMQVVDLNMEPAVEDSAPLCDTMSIVRSTSTRDYQMVLIEARGPNSRGVQMLRAGLESIGKSYDPQLVTTTVPTLICNAQGADQSMTPLRPLATREQQIAMIEARGPNSRGVQILHAGLADISKNTPPKPVPPTELIPMEALKHHPYSDGQFFRLYPIFGAIINK